jgi:cardiolipin synthase
MIANLLTGSRLLLIPVIVWLIDSNQTALAFVVVGLAALTDLLDGLVARRRNETTELGRMLDPLTDRLFISGIVIALFLRDGIPPLWALITLVTRDIVVLAGSAWLTFRGRPIEVTMLGKAATMVLLIAILLMVGGARLGLWIFYAGLILYLGSGFNYLARGKKIWKSEGETV